MAIGLNTFETNPDGQIPLTTDLSLILRNKLIHLLRTVKGSVPMNLEYGTDLLRLSFIPIDEQIADLALFVVREAVANWLPFIIIDSVVASENDGKVILEVQYFLPSSVDPDIIEIPLP